MPLLHRYHPDSGSFGHVRQGMLFAPPGISTTPPSLVVVPPGTDLNPHAHTHTYTMPLRCPPGALPEAYRLVCLRSVRAFARGLLAVDFRFKSESSKKCNYCTSQKEKCDPVSLHCCFVAFGQELTETGPGVRQGGVCRAPGCHGPLPCRKAW